MVFLKRATIQSITHFQTNASMTNTQLYGQSAVAHTLVGEVQPNNLICLASTLASAQVNGFVRVLRQ